MRVGLLTTFKASRKEPLSVLLERIHAAFLASGDGEPATRFTFSDSPMPGGVSSVERVLKRHPVLERFTFTTAILPGSPPVRLISNRPGSPSAGEPLEFATLLAVAAGVPRSFPFHNVSIQFYSPAFGEALPLNSLSGPTTPGVIVGDAWWVNGRTRSLFAVTAVDAQPGGRKLPPHPEAVAAILAACGKAQKTVQVPFQTVAAPAGAPQAVANIVRDYRARFAEILDRAALPHDLPATLELLQKGLGETPGPKKPALLQAFGPMGYDCHGGSGTFTLRRRTAGNLTVELGLDVGTWSNLVLAMFRVYGLGFKALLSLPVCRRAIGGGQYPIGDAVRWAQIVENLAALVRELDRSFVPEIETAAGPSPEWYKPES